MSKEICPYCAKSPTGRGGATKDHVFVHALGGRTTVLACKVCNDTIGHDVEGELQGRDELFSLLRQTLGSGRPMAGTIGPDETEVTYDFATRELRTRRPVQTRQEGDVKHYKIHGSPDQVRTILREMGRSPDEVEQLIAQAQLVDLGDDDIIKTGINHNLQLTHRLAAKCALGAGEWAFGDGFTITQLGAALRDVLWGRATVEQSVQTVVLEKFERVLAQIPGQWPRFQPQERESQVVFWPGLDGGSGVIVHVAGVPLGMAGQIIMASFPDAEQLPVLVRDRTGRPDIVRITDTICQVVSNLPVEDNLA